MRYELAPGVITAEDGTRATILIKFIEDDDGNFHMEGADGPISVPSRATLAIDVPPSFQRFARGIQAGLAEMTWRSEGEPRRATIAPSEVTQRVVLRSWFRWFVIVCFALLVGGSFLTVLSSAATDPPDWALWVTAALGTVNLAGYVSPWKRRWAVSAGPYVLGILAGSLMVGAGWWQVTHDGDRSGPVFLAIGLTILVGSIVLERTRRRAFGL